MAAAVSSRGGRNTVVVQIPRQWNEDREATPERARAFWSESRKLSRKAPVVYYLSRNGQLDHPHFMEVPLSSNDGLYLSGKKKLIFKFKPKNNFLERKNW
jgi:type II secretory pathway component PulJ